MPTLITRGVSSAYAFGLTTATGGRFGWMAQLNPTSNTSTTPYAIRVTSAGNYVVGLNNGGNYGGGYGAEYVLTLNSTGTTLSSQTVFENTGSRLANTVADLELDASDNVYSIGRRYQVWFPCCLPCVNYYYWNGVTKTNASSNNLGSTYFGTGNASAGYFTTISKFSDGTILIAGYTYSNNAWPAIVKLNSALTTVSWGLQKNSDVYLPATTAIDSLDNVVALQVENTNTRLNILKITSAGSITYRKFLNGFSAYYWGSNQGVVSKPTFDASSNIYFTGHYFYQQAAGCCTFYYLPRSMAVSVDSTSSTLRFAKGYVSSAGKIQSPTTPVKDSSDNMYFANYYSGTAGQGVIIFKINSSGVLQWARAIIQSSVGLSPATIGVTSLAINGTDFVVAMAGINLYKAYVLKMPTDGSGSGTTFSLGGYSFQYTTPTDYSVVDLTGLTIATDDTASWASYTPTLTTTGVAPAASTAFTVTSKKV